MIGIRILIPLRDNQYPPIWTSTAVKELFLGRLNQTSTPTRGPNQTSTPTSGPNHHQHFRPSKIFGIAVGCSTAIALIALLAIFFLRRRKTQQEALRSTTQEINQEITQEVTYESTDINELPVAMSPHSGEDLAELPNGIRRAESFGDGMREGCVELSGY